MSWVAVAIGGAAVIGAGASLAGSSAQAGAASNAAQLSQKQYEQNRADMSPWRITGQNALAQYAGELGIPGYNYGSAGGAGGGMQPQVYGTPQPLGGGAMTPGMQAALGMSGGGGLGDAARSSMLDPTTPLGPLGSALGMNGFLGIGRRNNSPLEDIAQGLRAGKPISDQSWAMAGYGPGGSENVAGLQSKLAQMQAQLEQLSSSGQRPGLLGGLSEVHKQQLTQQIAALQQRITAASAPPPSPGGGATGDGTFHSGFRETPGYQFAYDEGMRGVNNAFAARGLLSSGSRAKGIEKYGQGIADQEYNNYLNRIAAVAGLGQTTATQGAQLGAQFAQNQGNLYQDRGAATASGYAGVGNAFNSGIQNYLTYKNYGGGGNGFASYANGNWTPGPQGFPG